MQMQIHSSPIALELGEVTLVDADAVRFLAAAEEAGTELRNCPLFVREWIRRGVLSSQDASEMNQPRIHVFSRNDGTQYQFTHAVRTWVCTAGMGRHLLTTRIHVQAAALDDAVQVIQDGSEFRLFAERGDDHGQTARSHHRLEIPRRQVRRLGSFCRQARNRH